MANENDDVRTPNVLRQIATLRSSDISWGGVAKKVSEMLNREVSAVVVKNAYDTFAARSTDIIAGDEELKGLLKSTVLNQADQLKEINAHVMNLMQTLAKKTKNATAKEMQVLISAAREIREQIQLQANLLNKMDEGWNTNKINHVEYTKISINNLSELEKGGYIKILKRPGSKDEVNFREEISLTEEQLKELVDNHKLMLDHHSIQVTINAEIKEVKENDRTEG